MKSTRMRIVAGVALFALICLVHELDYREIRVDELRVEAAMVSAPPEYMLREHRDAKFYTPFGETDCRAPRVANEFRVYIEWCPDNRACYRTCTIEPRNPDAKRSDIKKRALQKS